MRPTVEGRNCLDQALKVDLLSTTCRAGYTWAPEFSLANSVVCRSPFLDFRLVEFAFGLDNRLKIRNAETKYILRERNAACSLRAS